MVVPEKSVELLRNPKIIVRISDYGEVNNEKVRKLCAFFEENAIRYQMHHFVYGQSKWRKCGDKDTPREENDAIVADRFYQCGFKECITLENGYISKCSRAIHAQYIQNFSMNKKDCVCLDSKELRKDLLRYTIDDFGDRGYFMEACRYCYGTFYGDSVDPAIQIVT